MTTKTKTKGFGIQCLNMTWVCVHPFLLKRQDKQGFANALGIIPSFFNRDDERPFSEQVQEQHIVGWSNFKGFSLEEHGAKLVYYVKDVAPEDQDPPLLPIGLTVIPERRQVIAIYERAWTAIFDVETLTFDENNTPILKAKHFDVLG